MVGSTAQFGKADAVFGLSTELQETLERAEGVSEKSSGHESDDCDDRNDDEERRK
jgi:hypothetical protein